MSYAIQPYSVSLAALEKCLGSRKRRLVKKLCREFGNGFAEIDELDEGSVPMERALTHLVMGEGLDENSGSKYGYALELLCGHFGHVLSNRCWSAMRSAWTEAVDEALVEVGVAPEQFSVNAHLVSRGSPIPLPPIDDFPAIGYLGVEEIPSIAGVLAQSVGAGVEDAEIGDSITEIRNWLSRCGRDHTDLVCFYS